MFRLIQGSKTNSVDEMTFYIQLAGLFYYQCMSSACPLKAMAMIASVKILLPIGAAPRHGAKRFGEDLRSHNEKTRKQYIAIKRTQNKQSIKQAFISLVQPILPI